MTTLDLEATIRELVDQRDALDALLRFGAGQDLRDEALFRSAFADDAVLDFTQPAERFGATVPPMKGIEEIARILTTLEPLHTTHTVTNPRVEVDGDTAQLFALVEAQHVRRDDPQRHLLLKNVYWVELSRAGARWVIDAMTIDNVWYDGDPAVLFG
jgi:ketosteroid isomerase-like protein